MTHTYTQLLYHLVWSTKNRENKITEDFQERLYQYLGGTFRSKEATCIEIGGMADHIHILARIPPKISIASLIRDTKIASTKWLRENIPYCQPFAWQEGYGAFSVSRSNIDVIVSYIQNQHRHHTKLSFRDEFLLMLRKHGIEFDERYLWK